MPAKTNVSRWMIRESYGEKLLINGVVCSAYQRGVLMFVISGNNFATMISCPEYTHQEGVTRQTATRNTKRSTWPFPSPRGWCTANEEPDTCIRRYSRSITRSFVLLAYVRNREESGLRIQMRKALFFFFFFSLFRSQWKIKYTRTTSVPVER